MPLRNTTNTSAIADLDSQTLLGLLERTQSELARRGLPTLGQKQGGPKPTRIFQVPDSVKYLNSQQLTDLTCAFRNWLSEAKDARTRLSRTRIWLLFLTLRHTGMRLGEALELDDRSDIDLVHALIRVRGEGQREVPIPEELVREFQDFFDQPMSLGIRGDLFRLDQGYVRRKFSARAAQTSIPRDLLNPRVLRHSRAIEMLRGGVPLVVVDSMLGHKSQTPAAQYVRFSDADTQRIMHHYVQEVLKMKTSARNMFVGSVTALRDGMILTEVEVTTATGLKIVSVITTDSFDNLGISMGSTIIATVKAPWVVLVKEENRLTTSARNKFCGRISKINTGKIAAEVIVDLADGTKITSLVTDESVSGMNLKIGDEICALVKAFSVILSLE